MRKGLVATVVAAALVLTTVGVVGWARSRHSVVTELSPGAGVAAGVYDLGVDALNTRHGQEQLSAAVYYPSSMTGHHRLVLIQHGGHTPCAIPSAAFPCAAERDRTDSYLGYGYLGEALARAGYVAVSVSAERTISSAYTDEQAVVVNAHLALWQAWATTGSAPFGDTFVGHLDLSPVGVAGHSRGGEAMARFAQGRAGATPALPVAGVFLMAPALPVDGSAPSIPPDPMAVLVGTCDGDVADGPAQYVSTPTGRQVSAPRTLVRVKGANHNFFNTRWTPGSGLADATDDGQLLTAKHPACAPGSPTRLAPTQQQRIASDAAVAFFDAAFSGGSTPIALASVARSNSPVTVTSSR